MTSTNPTLKNSALGYAVNREVVITLPFSIAAGVPSFEGVEVPEILVEKGLAGSQVILAQAAINTLLGSTNEVVTATAFESTAMAANDTFGFVLDCDGQFEKINSIEAYVDISTSGAIPGIGFGSTALATGAFTNPEAMVTASGNVAGRVKYTNITATGTSGRALVKLHCILK
jgi:hypothetical protein